MHISFYEQTDFGSWNYVDYTFDGLFLIDIYFNFVSAYHDSDFLLIDNYKIISYNYIRSWLTIDVVAIFPF